ncbi:MAG TPA: Smr/MutS family protein, partial [Longimicrobiales bacterium]|nr:Smr/MutS family protein [Longimicrobiales bacterium]
AARLREDLEARDALLRARERESERRARRQARDLLLAAREEVEAAIRGVREVVEARAGDAAAQDAALQEAARAARRRVESAARQQADRSPAEPAGAGAGGEVVEGAHVRIVASGLLGVVVELRDDRATVEVGGMRVQVPASGLAMGDPPPDSARRRRPPAAWSLPDIDASTEIDLRGTRAEEVSGLLLPALDAAVQADLGSLRIIHGKGTGALREVVSEILRADSRVRSSRPGGLGEGGTGVTVAELR